MINDLTRKVVTVLILRLLLFRREEIVRKAVFSDDPEKPYGRYILLCNKWIEIVVTAWYPGQICWPHVHGAGLVRVLLGKALFLTFLNPENGKGKAETKVRSAGESLFIGAEEIHLMGNCGTGPLVCIHIYLLPILMWIYNLDLTVMWQVCRGGAWNPAGPDIIQVRSLKHGM